MWVKVPLLGRYIWNSIFIASMVTAITMVFVIPAAYAYARLDFPFKTMSLGAFLAVNMFTGAVLLIPLYRVMRTPGPAEHLLGDDHPRRRLPDPDRHLAAARLSGKDPA